MLSVFGGAPLLLRLRFIVVRSEGGSFYLSVLRLFAFFVFWDDGR